MHAYVAQIMTPTLLIAMLPSIASLPYPIYGIKSYRRSVPMNNLNNPMPYYQSAPQQYDEQPLLPSHYRQQPYESDPGANYYVDDSSTIGINTGPAAHRLPQYQSFGLPTYRGEYKPTQYYYAHSPSYNYLDDRTGGSHPLDDLHEEMLQEDERERQSNAPVGQEQWFENAGHPRSLTNTFLNNLIMYNKKLNAEREREIEMTNGYNEDDAYYGDVSDPSAYDIYDQQQPLVYAPKAYNMPKIEKPEYFRQPMEHIDRDEYADYDKPYEHVDAAKDDEDVLELKSLSKSKHIDNDEDFYKATNQPHRFSDTVGYNSFDSPADDYDDDTWINWDRKRSEATQKRSDENKLNKMLNTLEHQSRMALKNKVSTEAITTTAKPTMPTATPTLDAVLGLMKLKGGKHHEGQKEVVLSRPATPVRHVFSDPVLDALSEVGNERYSQQVNDSTHDHDPFISFALKLTKFLNLFLFSNLKSSVASNKDHEHIGNGRQPSEAKTKQKRFVSNQDTLLAQQLHGLKKNIKA